MYCLCSNFQQLQTNGVDPLFPHAYRQCEPSEPVEQIVGKYMYLQAVCINRHGAGTYGRKVESAFSFLDEVLHFAPAAVILNNLIRLQLFHRSDNKREHVHHLPIRFLYFEGHSSRMGPAAGSLWLPGKGLFFFFLYRSGEAKPLSLLR